METNNSIISIKNQFEDLKAVFSDEINNYKAEYEKKKNTKIYKNHMISKLKIKMKKFYNLLTK